MAEYQPGTSRVGRAYLAAVKATWHVHPPARSDEGCNTDFWAGTTATGSIADATRGTARNARPPLASDTTRRDATTRREAGQPWRNANARINTN